MESLDKFRSEATLEGVEVPEAPKDRERTFITDSGNTIHSDVVDDFTLVLSALNGENGKDQEKISEKGLSWVALMLRKNIDYGSSALKTPVLAPHLPPKTAILVRMSDKIERLQHILKGNSPLVDEALEETLRDLSVYGLLYLVSE